jgi:hypothetical protein
VRGDDYRRWKGAKINKEYKRIPDVNIEERIIYKRGGGRVRKKIKDREGFQM